MGSVFYLLMLAAGAAVLYQLIRYAVKQGVLEALRAYGAEGGFGGPKAPQ